MKCVLDEGWGGGGGREKKGLIGPTLVFKTLPNLLGSLAH